MAWGFKLWRGLQPRGNWCCGQAAAHCPCHPALISWKHGLSGKLYGSRVLLSGGHGRCSVRHSALL